MQLKREGKPTRKEAKNRREEEEEKEIKDSKTNKVLKRPSIYETVEETDF